MKKSGKKLILIALLLVAAGTFSLQAQVLYGRGTGACLNYSSLTPEQKAEFDQLRTAHLAKMDEMRTKLRSTQDQAEWIELRKEKDILVIQHRAEIDKLLLKYGATAYRPGRPAGGFYGRGAGVRPGARAGYYGPGRNFGTGRGGGRGWRW